MDNPVDEISGVIRGLTQTSPSAQQATLERYFTPDAAFYHPFCRVDSFASSRYWVHAIYRWYKIMSPHIELDIHSIGSSRQLPSIATTTTTAPTNPRMCFGNLALLTYSFPHPQRTTSAT
jgi:hypothetical protein